MDPKIIESEVLKTIEEGLDMIPEMARWGWTGFPIYSYSLYSYHYFERIKSLTLCGFQNNLDMDVDAEWYLSVFIPTFDKVKGYYQGGPA